MEVKRNELPTGGTKAAYPAGTEVSDTERWLIHAKRLPPADVVGDQSFVRRSGVKPRKR